MTIVTGDAVIAEVLAISASHAARQGWDLDKLRQEARSDLILDERRIIPAPEPPPGSLSLMTGLRRQRTAYSVKTANIAHDRMNALRSALTNTSASTVVVGMGTALVNSVVRSTAVAPDLFLTGAIAALTFLVSGSLSRRRTVPFTHACVLHLAWNVSEYQDGRFQFSEDDLLATVSLMERYEVYDFNVPKMKTALADLRGMGAVEPRNGYWELLEKLRWEER